MPNPIRVKIDSMAFRGYGVSRIAGKVIFIPYSVTGEEGWVEIVEEKKSYSMGRLLEILKPSCWRVDPPCPYFGVCGGCQWQHIDYAKHGELKKDILKEILIRLGGLKDAPSVDVEPSPDPYGYRTRVQLKVQGKALGYYQERSHQLVNIERCPIAHPLVNEMISLLRNAFPSFSQVQEIEINISPEEGKGIFILHSQKLNQRLEKIVKGSLQSPPVLKGLAILGKRRAVLLGEPHLNFTIHLDQHRGVRNLALRTSPGSFSQVNLKQNDNLIQKVLEYSDPKGNERTLDLYAGVGNLTLPLAMVSKQVWGIEDNLVAVKDAQFNLENNGIKNCSLIHGKVEDVLENWKWENPDLLVLDPPRTGGKKALEQAVKLKPEKIIYVSCEPTTLARDIRLLSNRGYALRALALVDMFPQSFHMEVIGLLMSPRAKV